MSRILTAARAGRDPPTRKELAYITLGEMLVDTRLGQIIPQRVRERARDELDNSHREIESWNKKLHEG